MLTRGYVILAVNTETTDYLRCARALKKSIEMWHPGEDVTILTGDNLPHGDVDGCSNWRLANDWQVYHASPYDITIKLEADMFIPSRIDHWWSALQNRDMNICTTIRDYRGEISKSRYYRKIFDRNRLPDVYNAITYFKKSTLATEFYSIVRDIFNNWGDYRNLLDYCPDDIPTTDVVYAIATAAIGVRHLTLPDYTGFSMVHMKPAINALKSDIWYNELTYEISRNVCRIASYTQNYPVHYHLKEYVTHLESGLE